MDQQAVQLKKQADGITKSWIYLSGSKWDDAAEKYLQAANKFKISKNCS